MFEKRIISRNGPLNWTFPSEKILLYIFHLSLHVKQPPIDYLALPTLKLHTFKYIWQIWKLDFLVN